MGSEKRCENDLIRIVVMMMMMMTMEFNFLDVCDTRMDAGHGVVFVWEKMSRTWVLAVNLLR